MCSHSSKLPFCLCLLTSFEAVSWHHAVAANFNSKQATQIRLSFSLLQSTSCRVQLVGGVGESFPPNTPAFPPKILKTTLKIYQKYSYRHNFTSQIASETILEDLKSQVFLEEHAPRPPYRQCFIQLPPNTKSQIEPWPEVIFPTFLMVGSLGSAVIGSISGYCQKGVTSIGSSPCKALDSVACLLQYTLLWTCVIYARSSPCPTCLPNKNGDRLNRK